ncbi:putative wd40 domain-containing protein [Erysiphe necator]|uniref:Putative wd40 domain-containing protein n=1 Tax=Uncinula necator TaxID=52586 RepID=A0A0B1PG41_UNCNE|nr:putative wd40 domain-containing protein [Erysiphe necator]
MSVRMQSPGFNLQHIRHLRLWHLNSGISKMRKSQIVQSSSQSLPSPDGAYIAIILPSSLCIRETGSLNITQEISIPSEISVLWFLWSPSSSRILVGTKETLYIFSPTNSQALARIENLTSSSIKASFVTFSIDDDEILIFYDLGFKLSIINIITSESVDIAFIKLFSPATATKGFSFRPGTGNLTLLTRTGGKDIISLHSRGTQDVFRSWYPETIDTQGLSWSGDGKWLAIFESASLGFKLLIYTAGGNLYKKCQISAEILDLDPLIELGLGIKLIEWTPSRKYIAIGDYSDRVTLLQMPQFTYFMSFSHKNILKIVGSCPIWQEQTNLQGSGFKSEFTQTVKGIYLPTPSSVNNVKTGVSLMSFDKSGSLLTVKMENHPTTIWIWDVMKPVPRAILVLHATVSKILWHPKIDKQFMALCEGESAQGLVYIWNNSWLSPKIIDFASYFPDGRLIEKTISRWVHTKDLNSCLFFSDAQNCLLLWFQNTSESLNLCLE